jgi:hypothetical protein
MFTFYMQPGTTFTKNHNEHDAFFPIGHRCNFFVCGDPELQKKSD